MKTCNWLSPCFRLRDYCICLVASFLKINYSLQRFKRETSHAKFVAQHSVYPSAEAEKNLTFVTASESVELDASRVPPDGNLSLFFVSVPYYTAFENIPCVMALLYRNNVSKTRVGCFFLALRFLVDGLIWFGLRRVLLTVRSSVALGILTPDLEERVRKF